MLDMKRYKEIIRGEFLLEELSGDLKLSDSYKNIYVYVNGYMLFYMVCDDYKGISVFPVRVIKNKSHYNLRTEGEFKRVIEEIREWWYEKKKNDNVF